MNIRSGSWSEKYIFVMLDQEAIMITIILINVTCNIFTHSKHTQVYFGCTVTFSLIEKK